MEIENIYPSKRKSRKDEAKVRITAFIILVIGIIACGIINLATKGRPWSLLVLFAEGLFWIVFISRPLVENTIFYKIQMVCIYTGLVLMAIIVFVKGRIFTSIPIVMSSFEIFVNLLLIIFYKQKNKHTLSIRTLFLELVILSGALVTAILTRQWFQFLIFGIAGLSFVIVTILYYKEVKAEMKKRFYLRTVNKEEK